MLLLLTLLAIPLTISFFIGYLLLDWIFDKNTKPHASLTFFLAFGLGLGTSAALTFLSFILSNQFNRLFIIGIHGAVLLSGLSIKLYRCRRQKMPFEFPALPDGIILSVLALTLLPLYCYASYYPYGGWDAWSCWNLKARFLYLGGEHWQNMLDPILWRASPHYPLLLPLIHVWIWSFLPAPLELAPAMNSILFTILTAGVLLAGLKSVTGIKTAVAASLLFLTLPFYVILAISQYSDIVLGFYLLASLICLVQARLQKNRSLAVVAGLCAGFLSFTKPEGAIASSLLIALTFFHFLYKEPRPSEAVRLIKNFCMAAAIAFIPTIIFQIAYSPGNQTFINGLMSVEKPADFYRFKSIFIYTWAELTSGKWHGIWGLLCLGIIFSRRQGFQRKIIMVPLFLLAYTGIILIYYFLNTYFEITWWIDVTLNRILFSILPLMIFWIFYSLWGKEELE